MFRRIKIAMLLLLVGQLSYGQIDTIADLKVLFSDLGDSLVYDFRYIEEKATLYLSIFEQDIQKKGYRLLIRDIHPEGIFVEKNKIRVLTINNGHMFVEEKFRSGKRLSHNTNYIDIEGYMDLDKAQKFVESLRTFVKSKTQKPKIKDEEIKVYMSPRKN